MPDEFRLYIGRKFTGITVRRDGIWPTMWRVHSANGRVSDIVNLTRAKDAALGYALAGKAGGFGSSPVVWKRTETASAADVARFNGEPLSDIGSPENVPAGAEKG